MCFCAECHEERHFYEDSLKREISRMSMKDISCLSSFVSHHRFRLQSQRISLMNALRR